ncbi:hypothetical protein AMECASPLE_010624 [Ameca splendens]|uniref:Uncharacterized protein n=1 Tax=Ameca splendens TaxID=208324 RepID=A0ABV0XDM9_9TELE
MNIRRWQSRAEKSRGHKRDLNQAGRQAGSIQSGGATPKLDHYLKNPSCPGQSHARWVYRIKLCSREFPAETLSLRRQVQHFSQSEGRTTGPHHRGYSSNMQLQLTLCSRWMLYSTLSPDNFSSARFT